MPWRLVWRFLVSRPVRSTLTLASLVVATFLLCVLRSLIGSLEVGIEKAASNRLIVQSAVSLFVDLPHSYEAKIASAEGVDGICKWTWFGGVYQDPSNFFAQFAVEEQTFFDLYPEVELIEGDEAAFLSRRTACIIGEDLARRFDWKVGDDVPLQGAIFPRADGEPWTFLVAGIYRSSSGSVDNVTMFFHHEYLDEAVEGGAADGPYGVGVYIIRMEPGAETTQVMANVDAMFENGPQVVQTTTEAEFNRQFVTMLGSVPTLLNSIGAGVLFAILLAALNTMVMAGRERTQQLGILKALGFGDGIAFALLLFESLFLCVLGGLVGVGLAKGSEMAFARMLAGMFPGFHIANDVLLLGLGVAVGVGLLAGIAPAWLAMRLRPVDALRAEV
jgi:putative ABC transport system permease protein